MKGRRLSLPRRRTSRIALGIVVALVLVVLDQLARAWEFDRALDAVERSEKAMVDFQADVRSVTGRYDPSCDEYLSSDCQQTASEMRAELSRAAVRASTAVQVSDDALERVGVLPWHGAIGDAKASYLDHSKVWRQYFDAVTRDPAKAFTSESSAEIAATFEIAGGRFDDAVPIWGALFSEGRRVDSVWAE